MDERDTPGQRAHRAFWNEMRGAIDASDWAALTDADRAWWEGIARATVGEGNALVRADDLRRLLALVDDRRSDGDDDLAAALARLRRALP